MQNTEHPSVLLVDDAPDEREMYAEFLRASGYRTFQAGNVADALGLAAELHPAVIVTDVVMQGPGDGFTLTRAVKQDERTRDIAVVILTGRVFESDREAAARVGCDLFLSKPCLPDELASALSRLLANKRLHRVRGRSLPARTPHRTRRPRKVDGS